MPKSAVDSAVDRLPVWILRLIPGGVKDFVKRLLEMNAVSAPLPTGNPPPEVAAIRWFHRIDLGNGVTTPGADDTPLKLKHLQLPESLSGKTVLDIGAWDGFFSFEVEKQCRA